MNRSFCFSGWNHRFCLWLTISLSHERGVGTLFFFFNISVEPTRKQTLCHWLRSDGSIYALHLLFKFGKSSGGEGIQLLAALPCQEGSSLKEKKFRMKVTMILSRWIVLIQVDRIIFNGLT